MIDGSKSHRPIYRLIKQSSHIIEKRNKKHGQCFSKKAFYSGRDNQHSIIHLKELQTNLNLSPVYLFLKILINFLQIAIVNLILFIPDPERPPLYIKYSAPSSTSLLVEWGPVPPQFRNGIIRGFQVKFQTNGTVEVRERGPLLNWVILDGLKKFTIYSIQVRAFTSEGYGPENNITAVTGQDGMEHTYNMSQFPKENSS